MREILVSLPTAVSGAMRLYAAYVLCDIKPDYLVLVGAFFLTLATYAFDRLEDYNGNIKNTAFFMR